MKNIISSTFLIILVTFLFAVRHSISQVSDIDGNIYRKVSIGEQVWMAQNLNVEHYRNGDILPQVQEIDEWRILTTGAWCYYDNDSNNGLVYGKLYSWYAVSDSRGLAPEGWHVSSDEDWTQLVEFISSMGTGDENPLKQAFG